MDEKIMYYIYHIPGKKVGVTRNLIDRVTYQQGYLPDEYEVLDQSTDIDYISKREIELQQSYGYKVDRKLYKNLFNNMKINATEMTSTFPFSLEKLKGKLKDHLGESWETVYGKFKLNDRTAKWIIDNAKESMYDAKRSYIYNKAFFEKFVNKNLKQAKVNAREACSDTLDHIEAMKAELVSHAKAQSNGMNDPFEEIRFDEDVPSYNGHVNHHRFQLIRDWAKQRGLYDKGDTKTQFCKLMEEAGELGRAVLKDDQVEFVDAIGDMVVVLTNMAHLGNTSIEACIDSAYEVISKRTGKMVNGTFVKDEK